MLTPVFTIPPSKENDLRSRPALMAFDIRLFHSALLLYPIASNLIVLHQGHNNECSLPVKSALHVGITHWL